jgi:hypothetical protein
MPRGRDSDGLILGGIFNNQISLSDWVSERLGVNYFQTDLKMWACLFFVSVVCYFVATSVAAQQRNEPEEAREGLKVG